MRVEAVIVSGGFVALAAATLLLAPVVGDAADPSGSGSAGKTPAVKLETVPGGAVKRVILAAKAAERLGIETGKVGEEVVVRRQMVSGLIIPPSGKQVAPKPVGGGFAAPAPAPRSAAGFADFGRAAAAPAPQPVAVPAAAPQPVAAAPVAGEVWVLVSLTPGEWDRLAKDKPARLVPLATRDRLGKDVVAQPSGIAPLEDMKRSMLSLHYVVPGKDHGLALNNRMRVELELAGSAEKEKVAPYSAVFYDAKGTAWVYVNTSPLAFERQRIAVDRVVGDRAVLSAGPPVGTPVVTVGAALLHGAEIFGK